MTNSICAAFQNAPTNAAEYRACGPIARNGRGREARVVGVCNCAVRLITIVTRVGCVGADGSNRRRRVRIGQSGCRAGTVGGRDHCVREHQTTDAL